MEITWPRGRHAVLAVVLGVVFGVVVVVVLARIVGFFLVDLLTLVHFLTHSM